MTGNRYIDRWMLLLLTVLLLAACQSSGEEEPEPPLPEEDCYLDIYVYAPDRPIVTRGDVGEIVPIDEESEVTTLKIWVFRHSDAVSAKAVGYLDADPTFLNQTHQQKYQMLLDKAFANNPEPVDVYVVANEASAGLTSELDGNTTRAVLNDARISSSSFGVSENYTNVAVVKAVPDGGLPMSAVLRNQPVSGKFPALRVGSETEMATLQLTRAVSKLRFVLCRITEKEGSTKKLTSIDNISLSGSQIPTTSYLVQPSGTYTYTSTGYAPTAISYGGVAKDQIPNVEDPLVYAYDTQEAQAYEDLIDGAIAENKLLPLGLTYLRESDKQLKGTIKYHISNEGDQQTAEFTMAAPGDFLRNHSWIIYVYFMDSKIHTLTVTHIGMKSWVEDAPDSHPAYNW